MSRPWETWGTRDLGDFEREWLGRWTDDIFTEPRETKPVTWADITNTMEKLRDLPPRRDLHCGQAVWDMLRDLKTDAAAPDGLSAALGGEPLYGVPVHVDPDMPAGRWEMREGDRVVHSGDVTPVPGALYVPGVGFVVFHLPSEEQP